MLTESYRKARLVGMLRRAAISLGFIISAWLVHVEVGSLGVPELQFIVTIADVVATAVPIILFIGARVMPTRPLFSARCDRREVFTGAHGLALSRNGKEIDALCAKLGIDDMTSFVCLSLPPLTYRDAGSGLAWANKLIGAIENDRSALPSRDTVLAALKVLRSNLEDAKEDGARFCLKPIGGWSLPARMLYDTEI